MGRRNSPPHGNIVLAYLLFTGRHANAAEGGLLGELFADRNQRLSIITSDASLQVYRKIFQRIVPLQAYIDRSY